MRSVRFELNLGFFSEPTTTTWSTFAARTCSRGSCDEAMRDSVLRRGSTRSNPAGVVLASTSTSSPTATGFFCSRRASSWP
jgi:hypothetical protein